MKEEDPKEKKTRMIIEAIRNKDYSNHMDGLEKINKINNNEYEKVLKFSVYRLEKWKLMKYRKQNYLMSLIGLMTMFGYYMVKNYLLIYYYFMWDINIMKPKVSDYIVERYR